MDDVIAAVNGKQPGDDVELTLVREGDEARRSPSRSATARSSANARRPAGPRPSIRPGAIYPWADAGEVLRDHQARGRAGGRAARRVGGRAEPLRRQPAPGRPRRGGRDRRRAPAQARGRRRVRQRQPRRARARRRGRVADDAPAPRRRGPRLLPGSRAAHRLQGDQGVRASAARPTSWPPRPSAPTSTSSTPTAPTRPAARARASTGSCSPAAAPPSPRSSPAA